MKSHPPTPLTTAQRDALEARFALRMSARLDEGAHALPHDITERLRVAREQAIKSARQARAAALVTDAVGSGVTVVSTGVSLAGAGNRAPGMHMPVWHETEQARLPAHGRKLDDAPLSWGWRLALGLPIVALLAGLWGIQLYQKQEHVEATTTVDMGLLTDELPPDAYTDPGFEAFLNSDSGPTVRAIEAAPPEADGNLITTETESALTPTETAPAVTAP